MWSIFDAPCKTSIMGLRRANESGLMNMTNTRTAAQLTLAKRVHAPGRIKPGFNMICFGFIGMDVGKERELVHGSHCNALSCYGRSTINCR